MWVIPRNLSGSCPSAPAGPDSMTASDERFRDGFARDGEGAIISHFVVARLRSSASSTLPTFPHSTSRWQFGHSTIPLESSCLPPARLGSMWWTSHDASLHPHRMH